LELLLGAVEGAAIAEAPKERDWQIPTVEERFDALGTLLESDPSCHGRRTDVGSIAGFASELGGPGLARRSVVDELMALCSSTLAVVRTIAEKADASQRLIAEVWCPSREQAPEHDLM